MKLVMKNHGSYYSYCCVDDGNWGEFKKALNLLEE